MNTLPKSITSSFFKDSNGYNELISRWSKFVNSSDVITSGEFLFYLILRGKNYKKAFLPGRKMEHYKIPEGLYIAFLYGEHSAKATFNRLFSDILADDWMDQIRKVTPRLNFDFYSNDCYLEPLVEVKAA